jgi:diguanylate cyclase (GGDEF)-like protein/PAS domain S-box-containing protein
VSLAAVVTAVAVDALLVVFPGARGDLGTLVHDLAPTPAAMAAVAACGVTAVRRTDRSARRGWGLLAVAAAGWAVNAASLGSSVPLRLLSGVAAVAAVLHLIGNALPTATRVRVSVDGLVAAVSLLFLSWTPVLGPTFAHAEGTGRVLALSAPVTDILVLALLLAAGVRVASGSRRTWSLLVVAFILLGAGDGVMAWAQLGAFLQTPAANAFCWTTGALLVVLAARAPAFTTVPLAQDPAPSRPFAVLVPYAPFLIAAAETASQWVQGTLEPALLRIGSLLVVLLFVRQLLAQLETMGVTRQLDALLRDRTAQLHRQEEQLRSLVQHASDVLTIVDTERIIRYQSAAAETVLGRAPTQLVGRSVIDLVHPDDAALFLRAFEQAPAPPAAPARVDVRFQRADGAWVTTETAIADLTDDPGIEGRLLTIRDVTDRKHLEEQLRHDALHDPLTGLGNRLLFHERLSHAVARAARNPHSIAVLMLDLDGFKDVNDSLGHAAGDRLLCEVAARLRKTLRPGDTVARMGGDEFAVLLERSDPGIPEIVAGRILAGLRAPVDIDGRTIVPLGSMGVASATTDRATAESLLRAADLAMYDAKIRGKGCYAVFQDGMQEAALRRVELETDLRRAVRQGELLLHYQPIVEVPSGRITGVEALVRWDHPTKGLVPPDDFIPVAEDSDLVVDLGRWVLWEAATTLKEWHEQFPECRPFSMSVNVAARQLVSPWLVQEVERVLEGTGIDPASLVLEITEGALMSDLEPIEHTLHRLRDLGVRLAIDDFGTGWSSLSRLRSFPVDKLKIDRAFVREVSAADDPAPLIAAIVAMAHSLGLQLVAEGVETIEQLACLHSLGCEEVQGYLLSRPLKKGVLESLLAAPGGLLVGPEGSGEAVRRSDDQHALMALVASAAAGGDGGEHPNLPPAMLTALQRSSDLDTVYLTKIQPDAAGEVHQEVVARSLDAVFGPDAGTLIPWSSSPCRAMLEGGPRTTDLRDEQPRHPRHPLAAAGAGGHLSVPVRDPDGNVWGTLCGASSGDLDVGPSLVVLFELFSTLITQHLFGLVEAAASDDRPDPAVPERSPSLV